MSHCFVDIDVRCATPILMSLSWILSIPNNSIVWNICNLRGKAGRDADIIHRIGCPPGLFHPYYLLLSQLHNKFWRKPVTLSRVIGITTREFYTRIFGFKVLGNKSRCSIKKGWHYRGYILHNSWYLLVLLLNRSTTMQSISLSCLECTHLPSKFSTFCKIQTIYMCCICKV